MFRKTIAILLTLCCLLSTVSAFAETDAKANDQWVTFWLMGNEGMTNEGSDVGNTMMGVSMDPQTGDIRLMSFTWDTFVDYEGYDMPQLIDRPFRRVGPEETMKVFNDNFDTGIEKFMSVNFLNLAAMIDAFGGVEVDVTRAERNALNGMIANKKESILNSVDVNLLAKVLVDALAGANELVEYGPDTHLNGIQAVAFGRLKYDSVYNCCEREIRVIGDLFNSVGETVGERIAFYDNENGLPENVGGRRTVNLDELTDEDIAYLRNELDPIFTLSLNNLTEEEITSISIALVKAAYQATLDEQNIFKMLDYAILPLEVHEPYEVIGGVSGHVIDKVANEEAIKDFMFGEAE